MFLFTASNKLSSLVIFNVDVLLSASKQNIQTLVDHLLFKN